MSEHHAGPSVSRGREDEEETPPAAASQPGVTEVVDTSGPGDNPPGPVDVTDPDPTPPPVQVPTGYRRLKVAYPMTYFDSGVEGIIVSSAGTDVPESEAQAVLDAAKASVGVTVEEVS